ncbi:MAG TPA: hypothetical protein VFE18_08330 [Phenylobacterium sp.]|uniref:ZIP family metal transporter n=1 Tax=Phenylobacterium sp. TaxID=1871053 RepID=UPI002D23073F|nr:hypothetical protein [Phenylobacterium sp.]HZZ68168.1 hypothetical protein [Phenylobacterium sp.]
MKPWAQMVLLGLAAGLSTTAGGVLALRLRGHARLLRDFSRGAVVGVALLELLPEAVKTAGPETPAALVLFWAGVGFVGYLAVDRALTSRLGRGSAHHGHLGAGSLTLHSAMDGLAIGLAFQASATVGLLVAAAVIAHDLADGINTVNLSLMGGASGRAARLWLAADAAAPMLGVAAAQAISLPRLALSLLLAALAGALTWVVLGRPDSDDGRRRPTVRGALTALIGFGCILGISRVLQT